jgi:serine protease DegQ
VQRLWLIFAQGVTVAVAGVFVVATFHPEWLPSHGAASLNGGSGHSAAAAGLPAGGLAPAARKAAPSVVSVVVAGGSVPLRQEPGWDQGGPPVEGEDDVEGMGSAVIVSTDGYLLTNNHVVEGAEEIEVVLADRRHVKARVIGADPDSDLAVLKIAVKGLPAISFGQVENVQVGDAVLAIGNPFNVGQTVTSGIVSAMGRSGLGLNTFENFIQTDAAVNPGNSGGALVDAEGRLLGINTAIYSRSGGSMGIGFAIPVSTARQVMEGLIRDGVVTRGWIGVQPADVSTETARLLNLATDEGVLITGVLQGGPAGRAGVRPGDVVVKVAGQAVINTAQLLDAVAALKPGSTAVISVLRGGGQAVELSVKVAQRPRAEMVTAPAAGKK